MVLVKCHGSLVIVRVTGGALMDVTFVSCVRCAIFDPSVCSRYMVLLDRDLSSVPTVSFLRGLCDNTPHSVDSLLQSAALVVLGGAPICCTPVRDLPSLSKNSRYVAELDSVVVR